METVRLLAVHGGTTPPGRLRRALADAVERAKGGSTEARLLDLADVRLGFAGGHDPAELADDTAAVLDQLAAADAIVLATPVYRGSMTGALKNLIDLTPVETLAGKPVGLVAMGGSDHHYLGAERHLRDVLAFFGALSLPVAVYLKAADFEDGVPGEPAAAVLDELFGAAVALARQLTVEALCPAPLGAMMVRR